MALPVTVPNQFASATASIPLSQLDTNFDTLSNAINGIANGVESLANVQVTGGNIANVTIADVTVTSGNVTATNVTATQANVTTALVTNLASGNVTITGGTFSNANVSDILLTNNNRELLTIEANAATGTVNFDVLTQQVLYFTANASADWTLNVRGDGLTTLNDSMETGQSVTITFLATQGATAYYANVYTVDSSNVSPLWQGGSAPSAGNPDSVDAYVLNIVKTANATYTIFGSQTQFG
jgi:hypothetical protein